MEAQKYAEAVRRSSMPSCLNFADLGDGRESAVEAKIHFHLWQDKPEM
jgi:hypothetical protein